MQGFQILIKLLASNPKIPGRRSADALNETAEALVVAKAERCLAGFAGEVFCRVGSNHLGNQWNISVL
jgi:hypothetical protein